MSKRIFVFIFVCVLVSNISAQTKEAKQIDEFGELTCEDMLSRTDNLLNELQNIESAVQIYIVFYEGKLQGENPRRGESRVRAEEIVNYLFYKRKRDFPQINYFLVNGGYKQNFEIEPWLVPENAKQPVPKPTNDLNKIKYRKGKPRIRDCRYFY